jgi:hypothetical protein
MSTWDGEWLSDTDVQIESAPGYAKIDYELYGQGDD